jgi:serine/threonine protein kinase
MPNGWSGDGEASDARTTNQFASAPASGPARTEVATPPVPSGGLETAPMTEEDGPSSGLTDQPAGPVVPSTQPFHPAPTAVPTPPLTSLQTPASSHRTAETVPLSNLGAPAVPSPKEARVSEVFVSEASLEAGLPAGGQLQPGQILFGRYRVERKLGEGGMGSVWLVHHLELDAPRALKLIVSGIAFDPQARARFRREARVMAKLTHSHAVTIHDARIAHDLAFIEMEYVPGQSLSKSLSSGMPMPLDWTARIVEQLCDVLQAAHDLGIVHRDLKPSNLMLLEGRPPGKEHLKVLDFGIAKILDAEHRDPEDFTTRPGGGLFTPQYASPEQVSGDPVDTRADLYSVGVILYELLTGYRPFSGAGPKLMHDHIATPPPPFASRNPNVAVPVELEHLVLRCLAKNPADRPQSARELAEAFARALPHPGAAGSVAPSLSPAQAARAVQSTLAMPTNLSPTEPFASRSGPAPVALLTPTGPSRPSTLPRPRRRWPIVASLGLIAVTAGLGALTWFGPSQTPPLPEGYKAEDESKLVNGWPAVLIRKADGVRFIRIAGGEFMMGDDTTDNKEDLADERPAHPVVLSDFYLQEAEVTNAEMLHYFEAKGIEAPQRPKRWRDECALIDSKGPKPDKFPAVGISHEMAEDFAHWVGGQLPTEAQWEYAARSRGKPIRFVWGNQEPTKDKRPAYLETLSDESLHTTVGKQYPKDRTEQGIFDLAGNVREWCRDVFAPYVPSSQPLHDPQGPSRERIPGSATTFVLRGGSFATWIYECRTTGPRRANWRIDGSSTSDQLAEDGTAVDLGFRVVIEWPPRAQP